MSDALDFGGAIAALKAGKRVARAGWNGKGMHLYLVPAHPAALVTGYTPRVGSSDVEATIERVDLEPCIAMFTAQGTHQPGWLASQADMLAEDWSVLP